MFRPNAERDFLREQLCGKPIIVWRVCCVCVYSVLCMRDMYIQRCRHAPEHTHIHILMQTLMYVEVWNIMVCNQNVPDPNKHEQTPDVVRERPWRLSDSWEHM